MQPLSIVRNTKEEVRIIEDYIRQIAADVTVLKVLEAGCGQKWPLVLSGIERHVTGIDIDDAALALRKAKFNDLDDIIIDDLRTVSLPENQFDVIYTSYVLEHIDNIALVLENFNRWVKPGGVIVIKVPDRDTVYGFLARSTPHWLHVSYYRYIKGKKNAGKPGHIPYPIVYDKHLSRKGIRQFCQQHDLLLSEEMGKNNYLRKRVKKDQIVAWVARAISLLSFNRLAWKYNDVIFIIKKPV